MYPNAKEARKLCEKTESDFLKFKENLIKEKLENIGKSIVNNATKFPPLFQTTVPITPDDEKYGIIDNILSELLCNGYNAYINDMGDSQSEFVITWL